MEVIIETSETLRGYTALLAAEHEGSGKDFHEGFDLALDLNLSDEDVKKGYLVMALINGLQFVMRLRVRY